MGTGALAALGGRRVRLVTLAVVAVVVAVLPPVAGPASSPAGGLVSVIVQARPGLWWRRPGRWSGSVVGSAVSSR
jgi:hypothetical protein